MIWDRLEEIQRFLEHKFESTGTEVQEEGMDQFNRPGWVNRVWTSNAYRRAHVDVVDARETKKLWMMHVCVFPHLKSDAPVFGFDVIAGQKKITGCFFDFSPTIDKSHSMINWFGNTMAKYGYNKTRELPDWAKQIFSRHMVAAGNVSQESEMEMITKMIHEGAEYYLNNVTNYNGTYIHDTLGKEAQNRYAYYQKQNPHTPRTMTSLGLGEDDVRLFIDKCLFPEV
tara:strand:- start:21243 stop:21923 length:681 start_codon:yes stop_codon:yes gene_type:complete